MINWFPRSSPKTDAAGQKQTEFRDRRQPRIGFRTASRKDSIRSEIRWLVCMASLSAIGGVLVLLLLRDFRFKQDSRTRQLSAISCVLADNLATARSCQETDSATNLLKCLGSQPSVRYACVIDDTGCVSAAYGTPDNLSNPLTAVTQAEPADDQTLTVYEDNRLFVIAPIIKADQPTERLVMVADAPDTVASLMTLAGDTGLVCILILSIALVAITRLEKRITDPILVLSAAAGEIADQEDYSIRIDHEVNGEVAILRDQFNLLLSRLEASTAEATESRSDLEQANLLLERGVEERTREMAGEVEKTRQAYEELQDVQSQLAETARAAGMAEIANGVLHNVGNVLNSVNVSAQVSISRIQDLPTEKLDRIAGLLNQKKNELGDEWVRFEGLQALPDLLNELAKCLDRDSEEAIHELRQLEEHVGFVKQVIQSQQSFSLQRGLIEDVNAVDVFETARKCVTGKGSSSAVKVDRRFDYAGNIRVDKGKLLQILSNYVKNALEAVGECMADQPVITLSIRRTPSGEIEFGVRDNGHGITPESLSSIFRHGFTTKKNGHGFGLHSAACAAEEMGGCVAVHSDGIGRGALFTLQVPLSACVEQASP